MRGGGSGGECHSRAERAASACCTGIWEHISCVIMLPVARSRVSSDYVAGGGGSRHDTMQRMCRLGQWDAAATGAADGDACSMLAAGKGKCFHTNELCPALQWGHRLCSKLEARTRMKYKCSHCEPTWRVQAVESLVKYMYKKHEAGEDIDNLRSWCMKRGLPAHGQKADLIR